MHAMFKYATHIWKIPICTKFRFASEIFYILALYSRDKTNDTVPANFSDKYKPK